MSTFCLTAPFPLSVRTLIWKTSKELRKLWKNENSLKKLHILYLFLVFFFIFQSLTQGDVHKMTSKCPLLSYRDHTEKDVHLKLYPPPFPRAFLSALLLTPFLLQGADILYGSSFTFLHPSLPCCLAALLPVASGTTLWSCSSKLITLRIILFSCILILCLIVFMAFTCYVPFLPLFNFTC